MTRIDANSGKSVFLQEETEDLYSNRALPSSVRAISSCENHPIQKFATIRGIRGRPLIAVYSRSKSTTTGRWSDRTILRTWLWTFVQAGGSRTKSSMRCGKGDGKVAPFTGCST